VGAVAFVFGAQAHLTVRAAAAAPVDDEFDDELAAPIVEVGAGRYCQPHHPTQHPTHFEPSSSELNGSL